MLESDEKRSRYIIGNSNVWSSRHQYIRQEPSLIFWVCLYSLFYRVVFLLVRPKKWLSGRLHSKSLKKKCQNFFCTRPAGLSVCFFIKMYEVQTTNISQSKRTLGTWKPMVFTQEQEVKHVVLSWIAQVLSSTAAPIKIKSYSTKQQYGCALKASTWNYHINLNFAISFRYC